MQYSIQDLIKEAGQLPAVNLKAASAYNAGMVDLARFVNDAMTAESDIRSITGGNPLQVMFDNHKHHAAFMAVVFSIGSHELLARTLPWVYRAYHAHGFSYNYFPLALAAWQKAVDTILDKDSASAVKEIYSWMIKKHDQLIKLSETADDYSSPIDKDWLETKNAFLESILEGDHIKSLKIANKAANEASNISQFYLQIIQPAMYEIGMLWERAEISAAQEHLATAIVVRVMAAISRIKKQTMDSPGKAVVTSAPNEYHEIGAWMISDILEHRGWEVNYLGANTPQKDLLDMLKSVKPDMLAISVTMSFNINKAKNIISDIRNDEELNHIKVAVGGRVFCENPDLWQKTGADGFSHNLESAAELCEQWGRNAG